MNKKKRAALEAAGIVETTAEELLGLTPEESAAIESNFCPECGDHFFVHNDDGSCIEDGVDKSIGHLFFDAGYEYIELPSGVVHRAKVAVTYIGTNGYRTGSRYFAWNKKGIEWREVDDAC